MYLTSFCVLQAAVLSEAVIHPGQNISNQLVVACKAPGYDVAVHDDVSDCSSRQPQAFQQAPVCYLWPVHDWITGLVLS